ncbi:CHASE4 domain-containing protein [Desulfobulbus sp.]|uniref:CHASE4 domain-containing protein n=1 Tax=Desulfobulbus sp. TaxID=895 RepID=UPI00286F17D6|nr:CHASE4 domain-containing protein [Desulfobulbus sp.]
MSFLRAINRSLLVKTAVLIVILVSLLVAALICISRDMVFARYFALEQKEAKVQVQRVVSEVLSTLDKIRSFGVDWSTWDDTYRFVDDQSADYIKNYLNNLTFIEQRLNLMLFFNDKGELVYRQFFDLGSNMPVASDASTVDTIQKVPQLVRVDPSDLETRAGILNTPTEPLLVVSSPIITSLGTGGSHGRMVIGRYLNAEEIERIGAMTHLKLTVHPLAAATTEKTQEAVEETRISADGNTLLASANLVDVTGQPALRFTVALERTIFAQGYAMWKQYTLFTVLLALFFVILLVFLVNRLVLRRLSHMTDEVGQIKDNSDAARDISVDGEDEIGVLAQEINSMLASQRNLRVLHAQEEKQGLYLQRVLDTINCGILMVDANDRQIVAINKAGVAMIGHPRADIIGQSCHAFICPRQENDCPVLDRNERIDLSERIILREDGSELPVLKSVVPFEHDAHRFLIESFVDISRLKQAEAELRTNENRYRQFFDEDLTGDFTITAQGEVIDCNPAFARMFGYGSIEEIKQANVSSLFRTFDDWAHTLDRIRREGKLEYYESERLRRDGSPIYCVGNEIGEFNSKGELVRVRGYLFDDTKRVLMEREIRQNQKMEAIGTLAGGIAHDFNNILAGIIGYAEILLRKESNNEQARNYLGKILTAGEKARELIYQILAFSRKTETARQPVQLAPLIHEAMQMLRATLPTTIAINEQLNPEAIVMADPVQIHQIVVNLCTNAGHAMQKEGGTLTVTVERIDLDQTRLAQDDQAGPGDFARIRIEDTGHGIPEEIRSRIFDPFFTTKGQNGGTGLGLSVVHGIVRSLQGQITVDSTPGKGTRFDILLPLTDQHVEEDDSEALPVATGDEHVVYVDDAPFLVEIAREILRELGYRVTTFSDSEKALAFICAHPDEADLVISDMTMPRLTGTGLTRGIREAGLTTPVIIYTGYEKDLDVEDIQALGIREVLLKPIKPHTLAVKVREVLDQVKQEAAGS